MNAAIPDTWTLVRIENLVERVESQSPADSSSEDFHYIDISSVDNTSKSVRSPSLLPVAEAPSRARQVVIPDDVLVSTVRPALNAVAMVPGDLTRPIASTGFCVLRAKPTLLNPKYLFHFTVSEFFVSRLVNCQKGGSYPAVTDGDVLAQLIPLPPLSEQQRIVDILQEAEEIRRFRAQAEAKTAELIPAIFHDRFVRDQAHEYQPLHKLAEVVSGVAIGRKSRGMAIEVPYIRVANVQAGYIDLTEVKTTPATENEIEQYALQNGDVLLTEGGDFDKLGRGALWEGQVSPCIHQNHVFRVRPKREKLLPRFFAHYLQSAKAKGYFLRCAKKTTNLASINLTQLMALPVPMVSLEEQQAFEAEIESASKAVSKAGDRLFTALSRSLTAHAFTGQLTEDWREKYQKKLATEARDRDAALPQASVALHGPLHFRIQGDEAIFEPAKYVELNREQRDLLREIGELVYDVGKSTTSMMIKAVLSGVGYKPYFTAEMLAKHLLLPRYDISGRAQAKVYRNPNAIESDLTVLALRGFIIPLSRARAAHNEDRFAACYRLPITKDDDVRSERLDRQRKLATGEL